MNYNNLLNLKIKVWPEILEVYQPKTQNWISHDRSTNDILDPTNSIKTILEMVRVKKPKSETQNKNKISAVHSKNFRNICNMYLKACTLHQAKWTGEVFRYCLWMIGKIRTRIPKKNQSIKTKKQEEMYQIDCRKVDQPLQMMYHY